jgi:hypothetical protein
VLFISGVSQPLTHHQPGGLSAALVLCRSLSMPPYHSHHQPRGSSNITKQSSTTSSASLCAYTRTRIHGASSNKGIESETPPAAPEGSRSPARIGRLRACTAEQCSSKRSLHYAISIIASPMVAFQNNQHFTSSYYHFPQSLSIFF